MTKENIKEITLEILREVLNYNSESGFFTWNVMTGRRNRVGSVAGTISSRGYVKIKVLGKAYYAHRLAWLYFYGDWPNGEIDHVNRIRSDNKIRNIRLASRSENLCNKTIQKNNILKIKGVSKCAQGKDRPFYSRITKNGNRVYLGSFGTIEEASFAYKVAAQTMHGDFCVKGDL